MKLRSNLVGGARLVVLACCALLPAIHAQQTNQPHWVASWTTAEPLIRAQPRPAAAPASPAPSTASPAVALQPAGPGRQGNPALRAIATSGFHNQTVRMIVHTSIGGSRVRIKLENAFGGAPVAVGAAHIALRGNDSGIVPESDRAITFSGKPDCTIGPGSVILSDPVDLGNLGKALALASLDQALVDAFPSPLDLQFRWAKPLKDAWDRDPAALKKLAAEVAKMSPRPNAKSVFQLLTDAAEKRGVVPYNPPAIVDIEVAGKRAAKVTMNARGAAFVSIEPGRIPASRLGELASLIERFLTPPKSRAR